MKDKTDESGVEVQGIELIDLGDARVETKQWNPVQIVLDSPITWSRTSFDE
jgi:hypothetical protein